MCGELLRCGVPAHCPWRTIDDLELQTLAWVHWHNNERLHSYLGDLPPVEFELSMKEEKSA